MTDNEWIKNLPGVKTQAQASLAEVAFEALQALLGGIYQGDLAQEAAARTALDKAFDTAHKVTSVVEKLQDTPEAATSKAAEPFKKPPTLLVEADVQQVLLQELGEITTGRALLCWYTNNRQRIDTVQSAHLRNPLLDAVRIKRNALNVAPGLCCPDIHTVATSAAKSTCGRWRL